MNQRTQLQKIYQNQDKKNKQLDDFRLSLIATMYKSLCDNESYIKRVKKLYTISLNRGQPVSEDAVKASIIFYNKINKRKQAYWNVKIIVGSLMFAYLINKFNVSDNLRVLINKEQRKSLGEQKEAYIMSDIQANRAMGKCFYLCSSHSDSAKDHKPYQGKLYIDAYCKDKEALEYAKTHNIKQYQWVIDAPVYMVTRPNCRHYFRALSTEEVISGNVKDLINKYDMHRQIGLRGDTQTLKGGQNVEFVIKSYEDRLKMHQSMYKIRPNEFLESAMHKDSLLISKWKKKLK